MKISLLGYGKMGKTIEKIALQHGHEIVFKINRENLDDLLKINHTNTDVAIEFSMPEAAVSNLKHCLLNGVPVVCGTTGWLELWDEISQLCKDNDGAFLYASNFSLGVNIFFSLNKYLSKMMSGFPQYKVSIEEIHHTQKLDAPSGTAISLANDIIQTHSVYTAWEKETATNDDKIAITSIRTDPAPGTHTIRWNHPIDTIEIRHTAHSREGFALGAVLAAEWIIGKKGTLTMQEMLGFV